MSSGIPPAPQQPAQQPAPQEPVVQQQQPAPQEPAQMAPEDRILTPGETENLLRGYGIDGPPQQQAAQDDTTPEQMQMATEHFSQIPVEPAVGAQVPQQVPLPHEQVQQAQQQQVGVPGGQLQQPLPVPAQMTPQAIQQAVQQTQQTGVPTAPAQQPAQQQAGQQQIPVQQQVSPEAAALQAQNGLLQSQIAGLQQQMQRLAQPTQQAQQPTPQTQAPAETSRFNFQVPPQFMAGLAAEDEATRQYALNGLLNGVAESVAAQMRQEMQQQQQVTQQHVQHNIQESTRMQEVSRDMYGTYPELDGHRAYVQAAATQVGVERPDLNDWSPEMRDLIAEKVSPMVPGLYQKIQQIRAHRVGSLAAPQQYGGQPQLLPPLQQQYQQYPAMAGQQPLPQQQQIPSNLPPGVQPMGFQGGVHGQPIPTLARDANGNLVYVQSPPQPYLGGPQARPDGRGVSPETLDVWQTLGYTSY